MSMNSITENVISIVHDFCETFSGMRPFPDLS